MNCSVTSYASGDRSRESTISKSQNIRDLNWTSNLADFIEDNTPPSSPLQKVANSSFFTSFEDNSFPNMDTSDNSYQQDLHSTSLNLTAGCSYTPETISSLATPPDTPTFQTFTSHPLSISSVVQSVSYFPTPPDTPTSPFLLTLKPFLIPPGTPTAHDDTFVTSPVPTPLHTSVIQTKEEKLCQNSRVVLAPEDPYQNEEKKKKDCKQTRPKLTLKTRLRSHKPLPQLTLISNDVQEEKKEGEQETEEGRQGEGEKSVNVKEVLPEADEANRKETTVLFFIGSDLRQIADQFHATYAEVDRILKNGSLSLTFSTALTGCLSVSIFSLADGETSPEIS